MKRIAITNGNGFWFDRDKAKYFKEETFYDGQNWISKATGSQWHHEAVFITASGQFILNKYSNVQGNRESYEVISKEEAVRWFLSQEMDVPEEIEANEIEKQLEI